MHWGGAHASILPFARGKIFLPFWRGLPTEDSCVRKTLPIWRRFRKENSCDVSRTKFSQSMLASPGIDFLCSKFTKHNSDHFQWGVRCLQHSVERVLSSAPCGTYMLRWLSDKSYHTIDSKSLSSARHIAIRRASDAPHIWLGAEPIRCNVHVCYPETGWQQFWIWSISKNVRNVHIAGLESQTSTPHASLRVTKLSSPNSLVTPRRCSFGPDRATRAFRSLMFQGWFSSSQGIWRMSNAWRPEVQKSHRWWLPAARRCCNQQKPKLRSKRTAGLYGFYFCCASLKDQLRSNRSNILFIACTYDQWAWFLGKEECFQHQPVFHTEHSSVHYPRLEGGWKSVCPHEMLLMFGIRGCIRREREP